LKLDLHTHCREATSSPTPTLEVARRIVAAVKAKGLDGIAVTEHYTSSYGFKIKEIVDRELGGEVVIIPGQETDRVFLGVDRGVVHVVELYLDTDTVFRFIAHPGHPRSRDLGARIDGSIHGIELKNPAHDWQMDEAEIRRLAEEHNLLLLTNSDAHTLNEIGTYYNEIDLADLFSRARAGR